MPVAKVLAVPVKPTFKSDNVRLSNTFAGSPPVGNARGISGSAWFGCVACVKLMGAGQNTSSSRRPSSGCCATRTYTCRSPRLVPLALGSDTNGSIRVPAGLCGVYGLKPTFGRLDRGGVFPFVHSLDHAGPFARDVADLSQVAVERTERGPEVEEVIRYSAAGEVEVELRVLSDGYSRTSRIAARGTM